MTAQQAAAKATAALRTLLAEVEYCEREGVGMTNKRLRQLATEGLEEEAPKTGGAFAEGTVTINGYRCWRRDDGKWFRWGDAGDRLGWTPWEGPRTKGPAHD